jgi:hypothetical protein
MFEIYPSLSDDIGPIRIRDDRGRTNSYEINPDHARQTTIVSLAPGNQPGSLPLTT